MNAVDYDLPKFLQKRVRITRDGIAREGLLVGRGTSPMTNSVGKPQLPWVLRTEAGEIAFVPEDRWDIEFLK